MMKPEILGVQFEVEGVERAVDGISQFSGAVSGLVGSLAFLGDTIADVTKAGNYFYQSFFAIGPQLESMFLMVRGSFQMLGATAEQAGMLASKALKQAIAFAEYTPYQQWVVLQLQQALARGGLNVFKEFGTLEEVYMETLKRATGEEKRRIQSALDSLYDWQKQTKVTYLSILADLVAAHGYAGYQLEWVLYHLSRVLETGGARGLRYLEWWLPQLRRIFQRGKVPKSAEEFVMKVFEHLKKTGQLGASAIASGTIQGLMEGFREMKTSFLQRVIGLPEEGGLFDRFRKVMNKFYDEFRKRLFTAEGELTGVGKAFGDALKEAFTTAINIFERVGIPLITRTMDFLGRAIGRVAILRTTVQSLALLGVGWQVVGKPMVGFLSQFEPIIRYLVYFKFLGLEVSRLLLPFKNLGAYFQILFGWAPKEGLRGLATALWMGFQPLAAFMGKLGLFVVLIQSISVLLEGLQELVLGTERVVKESFERLSLTPSVEEVSSAYEAYKKKKEAVYFEEALVMPPEGLRKAEKTIPIFGPVASFLYSFGGGLAVALDKITFGLLKKIPPWSEVMESARKRVENEDKILSGLLEEVRERGGEFVEEFSDYAKKHPEQAKRILDAYTDFRQRVSDLALQVQKGEITWWDMVRLLKKESEEFVKILEQTGGKFGEAMARAFESVRGRYVDFGVETEDWKRWLRGTMLGLNQFSAGVNYTAQQLFKAEKLGDAIDELIRRKYEEARAIREALIAQYLLTEVNLRSREQLFNMLEVLRKGEETLQVIPPRGSEGNQTSYNKEVNINVNLASVGVNEIKSTVVRTVIEQARGIPEELVRYV